jgi:hypothetical protein
MSKANLATLTIALVILGGACGRQPLSIAPGSGGQDGGRNGGSGGAGGGAAVPVILQLPDGGLSALLGDSGILGGILDASRDSVLGRLICGPEARLGASCSAETQGCLLPSLGGACACISGTYLCPLNPAEGPTACPKLAATGSSCISPLSVCIGGGANACICGLGTYNCF